tara:strand:- start:2587 stop:3351 length:765 start_codon:yes stop_codon:yes gene_type:complete
MGPVVDRDADTEHPEDRPSVARGMVNASPVVERLVIAVQRALLNGDIRPGAKLPSQRTMVDQYSVSRSTVREAISQLQAERLIETRHGGGSFCLNLLGPFFDSAADESQSMPQSLPVQVLEMREMLEGEAAYYCALRATDNELDALKQEYQRMSQRHRGANTLYQAKSDLRFHMHIAENCHNLMLVSISQILYTRYFSAIYAVLSQTFKKCGRYPELIGSQHQSIFQAIMARDPETARNAARAHIAYTRGLLLS